MAQFPKDSQQAESLALSDFLYRYRISHTCKEQLVGLYEELGDINLAIVNFSHYPFFSGQSQPTRLAGCSALSRLSTELYLIGKKLALIEDAIRFEHREELKDWIARQEAIDTVCWPEPAGGAS